MKIFDLLERSGATEPFRHAVTAFVRDGRPAGRIAFNRECPPVKVERTLTKVLVEYPHLEIESIEIRGRSGCEYFRGDLTVRTSGGEQQVEFHWDCKWRAEQSGWHDYFGFPDQIRAAREYDWRCFLRWEAVRRTN